MELVITGIFFVLAVLGLVYASWLLYSEFTLEKSQKIQSDSIKQHEINVNSLNSLKSSLEDPPGFVLPEINLEGKPLFHKIDFGDNAVNASEPVYVSPPNTDEKSMQFKLNRMFEENFTHLGKKEIMDNIKLTKPRQPATENKVLPNFKDSIIVMLRSGNLAIVDTFNGRQNPTISGTIGQLGDRDLRWQWKLNGKGLLDSNEEHYMDIIQVIGELNG